MRLAIIGLGRMGGNMARRLLKAKHEIVAFNRSPAPVKELEKEGAIGAASLAEAVKKLSSPRIIWLMVPSGGPVDQMIKNLLPELATGDIVIDGGNSFYKDSVRRAKELTAKGFHYLDVGTSGGIWGLKNGYCLMIGGEREIYQKLEPIFKSLAQDQGYLYVGPSGSGHFVKMIHNGIEYGMLQAMGEGFEIMKASDYPLDFAAIAKLWNHGSVVCSWLMELAESAFGKDPNLAALKAYVEDSGEGRWTITDAIEKNVAAPVITLSLLARLQSRETDCFSAKFIAALRNEFGGHAIKKT